MNALFDLWPVSAAVLAALALNAIFALAGFATLMAGRLSFVAAACAVAGGAVVALPLGMAGLLAAGAAAGLVVAMAFGVAALRASEGSAALASLVLAVLAGALAARLPMVPTPAMPPWLAPLAAVLVALAMRALHRGWHGRAARVLRHDAALAAGMGIDARRVELVGFAAAGVAAGLGGVLLALQIPGGLATPMAAVHLGFLLVAAVLIGGVRHWGGAVLGAGTVTLLPLVAAQLPGGWGLPGPGGIGMGDLAIGLVLLLGWRLLPGGLTEIGAPAPARRRGGTRRRHPARARYHRVDR